MPHESKGVEVPCWECDGQGIVRGRGHTSIGGFPVPFYDCPLCLGSGKAMRFESMDDLISDLEQG